MGNKEWCQLQGFLFLVTGCIYVYESRVCVCLWICIFLFVCIFVSVLVLISVCI